MTTDDLIIPNTRANRALIAELLEKVGAPKALVFNGEKVELVTDTTPDEWRGVFNTQQHMSAEL